MTKAVKLTKDFLRKVYGNYAVDNKNGLFYSGDYVFKGEYINHENIKESEIKIIEDDKMINMFNNFKNVEMEETDLNNFQNLEIITCNGLLLNKSNYFDVRVYKIMGWRKEVKNIRYGIRKDYFEILIPKLLKANPNLKVYERVCKEEHTWSEAKNYFFVDNGEVIGILAPCTTYIV